MNLLRLRGISIFESMKKKTACLPEIEGLDCDKRNVFAELQVIKEFGFNVEEKIDYRWGCEVKIFGASKMGYGTHFLYEEAIKNAIDDLVRRLSKSFRISLQQKIEKHFWENGPKHIDL